MAFFKATDRVMKRYAPWSYLLILSTGLACGILVKFGALDAPTGLALSLGLFGFGMQGVLFPPRRQANFRRDPDETHIPTVSSRQSIETLGDIEKDLRVLERKAQEFVDRHDNF